jgi:hypothetical protein
MNRRVDQDPLWIRALQALHSPGTAVSRTIINDPKDEAVKGFDAVLCPEGEMREWDVCAAGLGCWFSRRPRSRTRHLALACLPSGGHIGRECDRLDPQKLGSRGKIQLR